MLLMEMGVWYLDSGNSVITATRMLNPQEHAMSHIYPYFPFTEHRHNFGW